MIGSILLAHLVGDYLLQNDYMANEKVKRWAPAVLHGLVYTLPFLFITQSWVALAIIALTHMVIDRYRLAKVWIWVINQTVPKSQRYSWQEAKENAGYTAAKPAWMAVWLMIIVDNTLHLVINFLAVYYYG